jgi:SAM-dependent methyltransferase
MRKTYDPTARRLVYCGENSSPALWDAHWALDANARANVLAIKDTLVTHITAQYLKPGDGAILEGGCGRGQNVAALAHHGYSCVGIDYAEQTVTQLNRLAPELDIRLGDVRQLPFADGHFAGYWSLGVIEHFWEGYDPLAREMRRALRPGGFLFLTFPCMSPLRRLKAALRCYPRHRGDQPGGFYQFALPVSSVVKHFEALGFRLLRAMPHDGENGAMDELPPLRPLLRWLYAYQGPSRLLRRLRAAIPDWAGHCMLLVLRKER